MRKLPFFSCLLLLVTQCALAQFYLLEQPIEKSIQKGNFDVFKTICTEKVSVNLDYPFHLQGYLFRENFIDKFKEEFSLYSVDKIEWISLQVEEKFAIQSLNVILVNNRSGKITYYKFIFFLVKEQEWKLYNLRGLKI